MCVDNFDDICITDSRHMRLKNHGNDSGEAMVGGGGNRNEALYAGAGVLTASSHSPHRTAW